MIFDVMSLAACLLIIVPASGSAAVLLQLSLSLLRIVFFLDVSESITALLLNVKKTELLAILSWISSSDLDKGRYMTSSGCCGIFEANYGYHITNDSLLCTSYRVMPCTGCLTRVE
ncbi:unnamed protein product [Dicrocoelium dendriticum]|nr:unnamed protein product [Dicrocoelium dendriticum]